MGILDGIVEWIAEQVMAGLDLITTSVLGALGCDIPNIRRHPSSVPARHPPISPNGAGWNRSNRNPLRRSQSRRLPRLKSQ